MAAAKHYSQTLKKVARIERLRLKYYQLTRDRRYGNISEFARHAAKEYNLSASYYKNTQSKLKSLFEHLVDDNYPETGLDTISKVGFFDNFMKSIKDALASKIAHGTKPTSDNIRKLVNKLNKEAKAAKVRDNAPEKTATEETKAQDAPDDEEEEEVSEEEEEKKEGEGATLCGNQPVSEVT